MRTLTTLTIVSLAFPAALHAQKVIDPGMHRAQVVERLGPPATGKTTGTSTFLFYRNGVERKVGMNDIVILEADTVVDAVFRSSTRKYSGRSSSPVALSATAARKAPRPLALPPG